MDEIPDFVMVQRTLTCHTPSCPNEDVPIALEVPEDCTTFFCGPCGLPIFDVKN